MSNYDFWDELGRIFNAVVAYQEKTVEFNDRFITPWIKLGNVFDRQDRNKEAVSAYQNAITIDPSNARNWYELGNIYFQMSDFENAADAYQRSTELSPDSGWAYNNLALTLVSQGKYEESISLYQKSIGLLQADKDKAVAWNRLGNVYRKLNNYEQAVNAFTEADKLDSENAGFRDDLDAGSYGPGFMEAAGHEGQDGSEVVDPIQRVIEDELEMDVASRAPAEPATEAIYESEPNPDLVDETQEAVSRAPVDLEAAPEVEADTQVAVLESASEVDQIFTGEIRSEDVAQPEAEVASGESQPVESRSVLEIIEAVIAKVLGESTPEAVEEPPVLTGEGEAKIKDELPTTAVEEPNEGSQLVDADEPEFQVEDWPEAELAEDASRATGGLVLDIDHDQALKLFSRNTNETFTDTMIVADTETDTSDASLLAAEKKDDLNGEVQVKETALELPIAEKSSAADIQQAPANMAYEEYLEDNHGNFKILVNEPAKENEAAKDTFVPAELMAKIDFDGDLQIEADEKNAHVWNELGNVYFNTGAYEDAVIAYSKSIELDRLFAWPYSNLALVYVQKGRFAEAMLLYQRSIELFSNDKDKAISWNRLGNVYRRLSDYDNAIAAYQRADGLDTDNATLSLQSRFSLLGNYSMDKKPSYAS